jgi:hypothetical protein
VGSLAVGWAAVVVTGEVATAEAALQHTHSANTRVSCEPSHAHARRVSAKQRRLYTSGARSFDALSLCNVIVWVTLIKTNRGLGNVRGILGGGFGGGGGRGGGGGGGGGDGGGGGGGGGDGGGAAFKSAARTREWRPRRAAAGGRADRRTASAPRPRGSTGDGQRRDHPIRGLSLPPACRRS